MSHRRPQQRRPGRLTAWTTIQNRAQGKPAAATSSRAEELHDAVFGAAASRLAAADFSSDEDADAGTKYRQ